MTTHFYGPRERSRIHPIPIYDYDVEVVVSGSIRRSRLQPKRIKRLGPVDDFDFGEVSGLYSYNGRHGSIFLTIGNVDCNIIAHEIFHATHRIMEFVSAEIGPDCHEPHAHLNGYLTQLVYSDLRKWKIKIK